MNSSSPTSTPNREFAIDTLADAVRHGANMLITGYASSGKSSLLCALAAHVPHSERVIVIDKTRTVTVLGGDVATVRRVPEDGERCVVQWALETYPDRLIVGDIRDSEVAAFVRAHSAGRSGGMASIPGASARGALDRIEAVMVAASVLNDYRDLPDIRMAISSCYSYVIHLRREGTRGYVSEVLAIQGFKDGDYVLKRVF
ncbi:ATPase, T2SS/T4P/T4SS family [Burkholderia ubonensis]|nr:ATPase, T2SS/T4P/T4SS family [Burkholderia ubonensis]